MIAIEDGFENPQKHLIELQAWANLEFCHLSANQLSAITLYISELYTFATTSKAKLESGDENGAQERLSVATGQSIAQLETELKGYGLASVIDKINRKVIEVGGMLPS